MSPVLRALCVLVIATALAAPVQGIPQTISLEDALGDSGLRDLEGRVWRADGLRGRMVLIDVWATWCAPCLEDLPALRALVRTHGAALTVLGVSLDTMPRRDFVSWVSRHAVAWPQHFDGRGYRGPAADRLGITSLPASLLFDREGRLIARNLRARDVGTLVPAGPE